MVRHSKIHFLPGCYSAYSFCIKGKLRSMADENDPRESDAEIDSEYQSTRRQLLAMAGLSGLSGTGIGFLASPSDRKFSKLAPEKDPGEVMKVDGDLNMQGNDIERIKNLAMSSDASLRTSGTGDGSIEVRDAASGAWSMRATEGTADTPGPVEFQAPIRGSPDNDGEPSLEVEGGIEVDELSIASWDVVDVGDHGVDPGSDDDLGEFIQNHFDQTDPDESIVYYLPDGTYTWNTAVEADEFNAFGLIGKPRARVKCTNPEMPFFLRVGRDRAGLADIFMAENIKFDIRTPNVAASAIIAAVDEFLRIDHCSLVGEMDRNYGYVYAMHPTLLTDHGRGYMQVSMPDGSFYDPNLKEQEHPMGIALERDHRGYMVIENSEIEGFINNGIYSAGHKGNVAIRNTTVRNCGAGMLRLGNADYAYKCHLYNDDAEDRGYSYAALWFADGKAAVADSIHIEAKQRTPSELVRVSEKVGQCSMSNININSHANQFICQFMGDFDAGTIVADNWDIYDSGSAERKAHLGRIDRGNTKIENWDVKIDPPDGGKRHGLVIDAPWVDILSSTFRHTGNGLDLLLDEGADNLRLKNSDFRSGQLYQYARATVENAIVADNRFVDGVALSGEQVNWTTRGQNLS